VNRQAIAESVLGEIRWQDAITGFCRCPGIDLHSNDNAPKDCMVHIDGAPTVFCTHSSCSAVIEESNRRLRSETGKAERAPGCQLARRKPTAEELERQRKAVEAERLARNAKAALDGVLRDHAIAPADLWMTSPTSLVGIKDADLWRHFLRIFQGEDVVWIGDVHDSGAPNHARNFRPVAEWLACPTCPGPRVAPASFKGGSYRRSAQSVETHRLFIVEHDKLGFQNQCAIIQYVRQWCRLRAVVFTGNKSLHAWFDLPAADTLERLGVMLPAWGIDDAGFRPAQPFRMPATIHEKSGRYADLLYLDVEVTR
jgi:hypothetical protein